MFPRGPFPTIGAAAVFLAVTACASVEPGGRDDLAAAAPSLAAALTEVTGFGSNPGALKMFAYVPSGLAARAPIVVAMHGCTESASVYATETEWNNLADRYRFAVIYPEQQRANNSSSCFNWFTPGDIARGQGEALSIKQMVDTVTASQGSDPARVFVTGMSAGGFMTEVMMATYPDVFAGGAVNSGGPYACATSLPATSSCQQGNVSRSAAEWGALVRNAFPGYGGRYPRLIAFHGASDFTVAAADLQQSVDQWSNVLGIDAAADVSETFRTAAHKIYRDGSGAGAIETYVFAGTGHALSVDPGGAVDQGGATGAFCEDHDVYSSYYAAQFWGLTGSVAPGDRVPPTVSLTSPADGATLSGTITETATASDDQAVARVEFLLDGAVIGSDAAAPYVFALVTTGIANGAHTLGARAFDAAGNVGTAAPRTVTVQNQGGGARLETFSAPGGADQPGWSFGGFALVTSKDATGTAGSRSLTATAAPRFGAVTQTATWSGLTLGAAPRLSYARQLALTAANLSASVALRVIINDGPTAASDHVVDEKRLTGPASAQEGTWGTRSIDLAAFAGKTVTLKLVVTANDAASTLTSATAWIDQISVQ
jgi:poly(hydroxyalkanoate) depolymerase family esterase